MTRFGRSISKERQDKLAWMSTGPKRTHFVWDGSLPIAGVHLQRQLQTAGTSL